MKELVKDLRKQVTLLEDDLRVRSEEVEEFSEALRSEYAEAREAKRTAATYETWRDDRVTQAAVAWVLGTVFVRYCEDNDLIEFPFIAGPGEKLVEAEERHEQFFRDNPHLNDRDWLIESFDYLASTHPTVAQLFDKKRNPIWQITLSFESAGKLLLFWRQRKPSGSIRYNFGKLDTRFLGDLYQELSESARKNYALLQTPEFVEELILDLTLMPAIDEFGVRNLRTIDPTCGSGHFLLGIFSRLLETWRIASPGVDDWNLIRLSLNSIHGCDKNWYASSIARFRLIVAVLRAAGINRLDQALLFPINIAVGDTLIHGRGAPLPRGTNKEHCRSHTYATEDVTDYIESCDLLGASSYHVVVGNPPYIEVQDQDEKENYGSRFSSCSGLWVLTIPFTERVFGLAIRGTTTTSPGYIGKITGNGFAKHDFGKRLIETFLPTVTLTHVIDSSGAYIPHHGTPTVILAGRNVASPPNERVLAIHGIKGEPGQPENPANGKVWSSIATIVNDPETQSEWVSAEYKDVSNFHRHPWSLSGGVTAELMNFISTDRVHLSSLVASIGYTGQTNSDEAFLSTRNTFKRQQIHQEYTRIFLTGNDVRDYETNTTTYALFPYDENGNLLDISSESGIVRRLWPLRTPLGARATFGRSTYRKEGRSPWSWHQVAKSRLTGPAITFPMMQTHQHFSFLEECKIHNRHAPFIKLPNDASTGDHLALLGLLNSSTASFWLKQMCHSKGNEGYQSGIKTEMWERFYEFTSTRLQGFPIPGQQPLKLARELNNLALQITLHRPSNLSVENLSSRVQLNHTRAKVREIRMRMISTQEELDWHVYALYQLISRDEETRLLTSKIDDLPSINVGERAFEIALARNMETEKTQTTWFTRHNSTPITEIPKRWPSWYREIIQARIEILEVREDLALIERPEHKRRWVTLTWDKNEAEALRSWLLDHCEVDGLWFSLRDGMKQPRTLTVSQLADQFKNDEDMNSVAQLYATDHLKKRDLTLAQILEQVVADQHVPYLAALRYKDTGMRKRDQWEQVWELQRDEDRTGERLDIPVPPKYASTDFRKPSYWSQRGKLDVPKERFVSYPGASPDSDPTLLLGWAGWDHKDQAQAIVNVINDRGEQAGWGVEKITPLLAGLLELLPWVQQWHGEYDDDWGGNPAEEYQAYFDDQCAKHQLTEKELRAWRPAAATRRRAARTKGDLL